MSLGPIFFTTQLEMNAWLDAHHASAGAIWVGYYKKASGKPSVTWPESVDEALCYGWIDGIRKSIDESSYKIRFTPRRRGSIWSKVNIKKAEALIAQGRMQPSGLEAFRARERTKSGVYSYEQRSARFEPRYETRLRRNKAAWRYLDAQPVSYRKVAGWWILSAKREETRLRRVEKLIAYSMKGERLPETLPGGKRGERG